MKLLSRHNEGVMLVTQNNELHTLTVLGMNDNLRQMLGYDDLSDDMPFSQLLGSSAEKMIADDIEYDDDAKDLLEVLRSHRQIRLLRQNGVEVNLDMQIMRSAARDRHHLFRLVFSMPSLREAKKTLAQILKQSFAGYEVRDKETTLPDEASMRKYIELTQSYMDNKPITTCLVTMRLEHYDNVKKLNNKHGVNILAHIAGVIQRNLRGDDTVGRVATDALGIILVDINDETVHLALNRIKHMVLQDPVRLKGGELHVPLVRQSAVFLGNHTHDDVLQYALSLLDKDNHRDIIVEHAPPLTANSLKKDIL